MHCGFKSDNHVAMFVRTLHEHAERCHYGNQDFLKKTYPALHKASGWDGVYPRKPRLRPCSPITPPASPPSPRLSRNPLPNFVPLGCLDLSKDDFNPQQIYMSHKMSQNLDGHCRAEFPSPRLFNADPKMIAYGIKLRLTNTDSN